MVGASLRGICASYNYIRKLHLRNQIFPFFLTFNSARVKPRPALTRLLYLMVGHLTTGLNKSIGRGATAAVFARRALRRLSFRPGCYIVRSDSRTFDFPFTRCLPGRSEL
jgi:hypothetical protein